MHWEDFAVVRTMSDFMKAVCLLTEHHVLPSNALMANTQRHTDTHTHTSMQDCADYIMMMFGLSSSWNIKNYEYLYFISSSCSESISCLPFSGDIFFSLEYVRKQFDSLRNCHGQVCLYLLGSMSIQKAK